MFEGWDSGPQACTTGVDEGLTDEYWRHALHLVIPRHSRLCDPDALVVDSK